MPSTRNHSSLPMVAGAVRPLSWLAHDFTTLQAGMFGPYHETTSSHQSLHVIGEGYYPLTHDPMATDDWPFLYLREYSFPLLYILGLLMVALYALGGTLLLAPRQTLRRFDWHMFFLGVAFMLLEVKSLSHLLAPLREHLVRQLPRLLCHPQQRPPGHPRQQSPQDTPHRHLVPPAFRSTHLQPPPTTRNLAGGQPHCPLLCSPASWPSRRSSWQTSSSPTPSATAKPPISPLPLTSSAS